MPLLETHPATPGSAPTLTRRDPALLRRTAAVLGAVSGMLHLLMLAHGPLMLGLVMACAALACLPCAGHLWRRSTVRMWSVVGVMNLLMVLLHLGLMASGAHRPEEAASPALAEQTAHAPHHTALTIGLPLHDLLLAATLIAAVEVLLCAAGLWRLVTDRSLRPPQSATAEASCHPEQHP